ncbi:tetrapyrrole biosynthesis, uroporphyrinogen III synthase [Hysterangium stoloniferum]|nr:tetrapyrrole biosynthesis, uroporphyrinogen III synthase [Hysterangium stoloniferum]
MSSAVILLKSPARNAEDAYVKHLTSAGYMPYFIEVLDSMFRNESLLQEIMVSGPTQRRFSGVVITSSRAADAWIDALRNAPEPGDWSQTPFYVVGMSTARTLQRMTELYPEKFSESLILGATQSGKSESLARFILSDLPSRHTQGKLLYLTGDKNRDTLRQIMSENNIDVKDLMVYETAARGDLEEIVIRTVQAIKQAGGKDRSIWIICFAPSSSEFALPHLERHFRLPQLAVSDGHNGLQAKLAAIGSTTADFLRLQKHLRVDAVPDKPTAEQLVASMCESDARNNSVEA